jgi:hypothetical protein
MKFVKSNLISLFSSEIKIRNISQSFGKSLIGISNIFNKTINQINSKKYSIAKKKFK